MRRAGARRVLGLLAGFVVELASVALVVGVPGAWLVRHADWGTLAAARASMALHRAVTIGHLDIGWGRTLHLDARDITVANIPGGTEPAMLTLRRLTAALDARSVLDGPMQVHAASIEGASLLLERLPDHTPNWRTRPPGAAPPSDPTGRIGFPSLRDVRLDDSELRFRTLSGRVLRTRFDHAAVATTADDSPARLTIAGAYNDVPITLDADLESIAHLREVARPFGTVLRFASGPVRLVFDGTMTDPLAVDGATGTLDLAAPDPAPLFAIAGSAAALDAPLFLNGPFAHRGPVWRLDRAPGSLGPSEVVALTLALTEGGPGAPDQLDVDATFGDLDLDELIGTGAPGKRSADLPLTVERSPKTLVTLRLAAQTLHYAGVAVTAARVEGAIEPGRLSLQLLSLTMLGTQLKATGHAEAEPSGSRIVADVEAAGADIQLLRRELGFGAVPLTGRLDAQVAVQSAAPTLNQALRTARVSAVVAMRGGAVEKSVVEMASTDLRALFRTNKGMTPVTCLLAGVDMRGGVGTLAPLRLRAAEGTIAGSAQFDLNRRTLDLTIGSEARSTGLFALDIPVRVQGPFANLGISPAQWSPQGRAQLAAADNLSRLPPALQAFARRHPCARG